MSCIKVCIPQRRRSMPKRLLLEPEWVRLSTERAWEQWHLTTMNTSDTQIFVYKIFSTKRNQESWEKLLISGLWGLKFEMSLIQLGAPERRWIRSIMWTGKKGTETSQKDLPLEWARLPIQLEVAMYYNPLNKVGTHESILIYRNKQMGRIKHFSLY